MTHISELLDPRLVRCRFPIKSRKRLLQAIAEAITEDSLENEGSAVDAYEALMERERLGSTGLGQGVAIPHCRMPVPHMRGMLLTLDAPIDYEASDGVDIDLVFVLVVPIKETRLHIEALKRLATIFNEESNLAQLRAAPSAADLLATFRKLDEAEDDHSKFASQSA